MSTRKVVLLWALLVATTASAAAERPPNVVLIFTDDQGWADLGCFGATKIRTPHIDRMAREGVRFTSFYAQAVCGPSRAALMTGCYPIRVAEPGNRKHQHTILHSEEITIAELLRGRGYATAAIGKWHLGLRAKDGGWDPSTMPNGQGFDHFYGTPLYNGFTVRVEDHKFRSPLLRNREVVKPAIDSWDGITADYTRETIRFIREHRDRPFFVYLAHNMPHIPLGASEKFRGRSKYGPYGDAIEEIDASTGAILAALEDLDLDASTLVIFTSDNGPWIETTRGNQPGGRPFIPAEHSGTALPLRGYKMLTWEGGLRVPCVMRWPGRIPAGGVCGEVAATIDLLPTLANLAGAELPTDRKLDGRDIASLITGAASSTQAERREAFYYYAFTHLQAVRSGRWKLILPRPEFPKWVGWSGRFHGSGVPAPRLHDLAADPGERRDVSSEHPEVVSRLSQLVEKAREDLGDYDRIGSGARFFDDGPRRPGLWRPDAARRDGGSPRGRPSRPPVVWDRAAPVGKLRFDFEIGDLQDWKVVEGEFGAVVTDRVGLPNHRHQPFNKQKRFLVFTGNRTDRDTGDDRFTGVIESPVFVLRSAPISFLVGGGATESTRVALCTLDGKEVRKASGQGGPALRRVRWDARAWIGRPLVLRIVDASRSGWGHVTCDDFSCDGEIDAAATAVRRGDG